MNEEAIEIILMESIANLFKHQPNISHFTVQTGQTEWNLSYHLATEIHKFFPWFDLDFDVTKHSAGEKRPDIIFHKRGNHKTNFLVVEVKHNGLPGKIQEDEDKIKNFWFSSQYEYKYQFGAIINLRTESNSEVKVFKNSTDSN